MDICAVNSAFIHTGSPPGSSQHLHWAQAGKAKSSRETQGLNEDRDSLNSMYVKEFIGSKEYFIYRDKSSV